jgi:hypothetical protein
MYGLYSECLVPSQTPSREKPAHDSTFECRIDPGPVRVDHLDFSCGHGQSAANQNTVSSGTEPCKLLEAFWCGWPIARRYANCYDGDDLLVGHLFRAIRLIPLLACPLDVSGDIRGRILTCRGSAVPPVILADDFVILVGYEPLPSASTRVTNQLCLGLSPPYWH